MVEGPRRGAANGRGEVISFDRIAFYGYNG
jgi:hypothetical protein